MKRQLFTHKKAHTSRQMGERTSDTQHAANQCRTDSLLNFKKEPSGLLGTELGASVCRRSAVGDATGVTPCAWRINSGDGEHHSNLTFRRSTHTNAHRRAFNEANTLITHQMGWPSEPSGAGRTSPKFIKTGESFSIVDDLGSAESPFRTL